MDDLAAKLKALKGGEKVAAYLTEEPTTWSVSR